MKLLLTYLESSEEHTWAMYCTAVLCFASLKCNASLQLFDFILNVIFDYEHYYSGQM